MRIRPLSRTCSFDSPHKESSASCYLALVRRFLRPCVLSTSRVLHLVMSFQARCFKQIPHRFPLFQEQQHGLCSTLLLFRCVISPGIKNPTRRVAGRDHLKASNQFTSGLALTRPILPLSRRLRRSRLLTRRFHSATFTIGTPARAGNGVRPQVGRQPSGVGRLNVSAACVERATTMRTGSVFDAFISTCTTCGGTHTKSPACASRFWSRFSPL